MEIPEFTVGIDVASKSFVASIFRVDQQQFLDTRLFENSSEGIKGLVAFFEEHDLRVEQTLICMEATGVYTERLCYGLAEHRWRLVVESPQKVKRAFYKKEKSDPVDSQQIAEYAWRFADQLCLWRPNEQIVEELRVLLTAREQLIGYRTSERNSLWALKRKEVISQVAFEAHQAVIAHLSGQISLLEQEITNLIESHPKARVHSRRLRQIPGVGLLMIANLAVLTNAFSTRPQASSFTAFLGISPYGYSSGSSVRRRPRSTQHGQHRMRKLLYLASMVRKRYDRKTQEYYQRKIEQGKPGRLVLNNIANKLVRLICAMIAKETDYDPNYQISRA